MPQRPPSEDNSEQGRAPSTHQRSQPSFRFPLGMSRTRSMGVGGLAAASIGWVMVGCTALGFGAGLWLDKKFGTGFWMPTLTFVGIAAGFREMFATLGHLSQQQGRPQVAKPLPATSTSGAPLGEKTREAGERRAVEAQASEAPRQQLFTVPPPPFMEQLRPPVEARELDSAEIRRRLLGVEDDKAEGEEKSDAV